jgi:hypothetical protein
MGQSVQRSDGARCHRYAGENVCDRYTAAGSGGGGRSSLLHRSALVQHQEPCHLPFQDAPWQKQAPLRRCRAGVAGVFLARAHPTFAEWEVLDLWWDDGATGRPSAHTCALPLRPSLEGLLRGRLRRQGGGPQLPTGDRGRYDELRKRFLLRLPPRWGVQLDV